MINEMLPRYLAVTAEAIRDAAAPCSGSTIGSS